MSRDTLVYSRTNKEIKEDARKILAKRRSNLSDYLHTCLVKLVNQHKKGKK